MNLKLEKLLTAGFAAAQGATFIASTSAEAFWGGVIAQQRKMIFGTWDCLYETDGKIYRSDLNHSAFVETKHSKQTCEVSGQLQLNGTWKTNKISELVFPAGGTSEIRNFRTG